MYKQNRIKKVVYFSAVLVLIVVIMFSGLQILESTVLHISHDQNGTVESKTITRNGIEYFPRQDLDLYLVMGIDRMGVVEDSGSYLNNGAADSIMLLMFDQTSETINVLALNRDTMVEMPVLGIGGRKAGTTYGQLALAHTYGSGLADSCENTVETVSELLYGINIDHYVSMNMDAISLLNDAVGGVKVEVEEDFSAVDTSIRKGEMVLQGDQALSYVRLRKDVGDQLNISRMERQKKYVHGFMDALKSSMTQNSTFAVKLFDEISPYMVTDCSLTVLSSALERYQDYSLQEIVIPKGENVVGEEYMEFRWDENDLDAIILRMLYAPKKK